MRCAGATVATAAAARLRWHTIRLCQLRQMVVDHPGMKATIAEGGQLEQADENGMFVRVPRMG